MPTLLCSVYFHFFGLFFLHPACTSLKFVVDSKLFSKSVDDHVLLQHEPRPATVAVVLSGADAAQVHHNWNLHFLRRKSSYAECGCDVMMLTV